MSLYEDEIHIVAITDRNATTAWVAVGTPEEGLEATGSSKREPGDHHSEDIGLQLALARALRNLADQLETGARESVNELNPVPEVIDVEDQYNLGGSFEIQMDDSQTFGFLRNILGL